jgi:hypothetical protein
VGSALFVIKNCCQIWVVGLLMLNTGGFVMHGEGDCFDRYHQDNLRRRAAENKREEKYYAAKC